MQGDEGAGPLPAPVFLLDVAAWARDNPVGPVPCQSGATGLGQAPAHPTEAMLSIKSAPP
jgi:hypothetical protein